MRAVGPRLRQHDVGRQNLAAAFPEKSREDIEDILAGVWTNLGRVAAEFPHLEGWARTSPENSSIVTYDEATAQRFLELRDDQRGRTVVFGAYRQLGTPRHRRAGDRPANHGAVPSAQRSQRGIRHPQHPDA